MRFKGLDLNLLVALDVLLDERSVSRAAERLSLTQSAVSAALARLRDYFNDPLLALHGKRMIPTAQALALRGQVKDLLRQVDVLSANSRAFDPATSNRLFRADISDFMAAVLFVDLIPRLKTIAPNVRFELRQTSSDMIPALDRGETDLVISPEEHCHPRHPAELLFEERYVVVGWSDGWLAHEELTQERFARSGHVVATFAGGIDRPTFGETHLQSLGLERNIEVLVSSFTMVPQLIAGTDRIAVVQERLAARFARTLPIVARDLPFEFPRMREMIQSHVTREGDAGVRWLKQQIRDSV